MGYHGYIGVFTSAFSKNFVSTSNRLGLVVLREFGLMDLHLHNVCLRVSLQHAVLGLDAFTACVFGSAFWFHSTTRDSRTRTDDDDEASSISSAYDDGDETSAKGMGVDDDEDDDDIEGDELRFELMVEASYSAAASVGHCQQVDPLPRQQQQRKHVTVPLDAMRVMHPQALIDYLLQHTLLLPTCGPAAAVVGTSTTGAV
jgi:hypothetical protein